MNKKIFTVLLIGAAVLGIYAVFGGKKAPVGGELHQVEQQTMPVDENKPAAALQKQENKPEQFTDFIDMTKWRYNAADNVYYQLEIFYAKTPVDLQRQKMALFVPEKYLKCQNNDDETFSCVKDMSNRIENFNVRNAPIVLEINSPDFASTPALSEYRDYTQYTNKGLVYVHIGFRGIEAGAPYGVADIKAALRYLHKNNQVFPANTDRIFMLGANQGATLAAIVGASGNDKAYTPYLQETGALKGVDDTVFGVMLINPVSGLDTANEAVEWALGGSRQNMTPQQQEISKKMAKQYADYINKAGIISPYGQALTIQWSADGMYQEGTYYDYVKDVIASSLEKFLHNTTFPYTIPKSWEISEDTANSQNNIVLTGTAQTEDKFIKSLNAEKTWVKNSGIRGLQISSLADFNRIFKRKIPQIAAADGLDKKQNTNILFGRGSGESLHFDRYTISIFKNSALKQDFGSDLYKQDKNGSTTLKRVNLYNPLYYLLPSYEGYNSATPAPYWYIRNGLFQTTDVLTTSLNLALALSNNKSVKTVDYQTVWGMGDVDGISKQQRGEFINWIIKQ